MIRGVEIHEVCFALLLVLLLLAARKNKLSKACIQLSLQLTFEHLIESRR